MIKQKCENKFRMVVKIYSKIWKSSTTFIPKYFFPEAQMKYQTISVGLLTCPVAIPSHLFRQWFNHCKLFLDFTAAGTVQDFHLIPLFSPLENQYRLQRYKIK